MSKNRDKFVDLAEKRVTKALKDIRLIGNLSNRSNYSYNDDDVKKIISALEAELRNLKKRFEAPTGDSGVNFKL
jgi:transcription elongation GreA/GreB family factor